MTFGLNWKQCDIRSTTRRLGKIKLKLLKGRRINNIYLFDFVGKQPLYIFLWNIYYINRHTKNKKTNQTQSVFLRVLLEPRRADVWRHPMTSGSPMALSNPRRRAGVAPKAPTMIRTEDWLGWSILRFILFSLHKQYLSNIHLDNSYYFPIVAKFCFLGGMFTRDGKEDVDMETRINLNVEFPSKKVVSNPCDFFEWMPELVFDEEAPQHALFFPLKCLGYVSVNRLHSHDHHNRTTR